MEPQAPPKRPFSTAKDLAAHSNVVAERLRDTDDDVCYEAGPRLLF